MATAALDRKRPSRSLKASVAGFLVSVVFPALGRLVRPRSASLANFRKMPLTVAGLGCIDTGVFTASVVAGWIITGLSLIVLEYMIADET